MIVACSSSGVLSGWQWYTECPLVMLILCNDTRRSIWKWNQRCHQRRL